MQEKNLKSFPVTSEYDSLNSESRPRQFVCEQTNWTKAASWSTDKLTDHYNTMRLNKPTQAPKISHLVLTFCPTIRHFVFVGIIEELLTKTRCQDIWITVFSSRYNHSESSTKAWPEKLSQHHIDFLLFPLNDARNAIWFLGETLPQTSWSTSALAPVIVEHWYKIADLESLI